MKIHHIRHNRNKPMPKVIYGHKIDDYYLQQFYILIKSTPITLTINKKKFKL
jgi:hypothetical protein